LDAEVIGISTDGRRTHRAFTRVLQLPFPLIADRRAAIASDYGVSRAQGWLPSRRVTFVIDTAGTVQRVITSELDISRHVDEALGALQGLARGKEAGGDN